MIPAIQRLAQRLRAVFRKPELDADLDDEPRHHLDCLTEEHIARGIPPAAARRAARLDDRDHPNVMIINQALARRFFGERNPVGEHLFPGGDQPFEIIGVVEEIRHTSPEQRAGHEMYLHVRQVGSGSFDLMVRTTQSVASFRQDLRNALREVDPTLPVTQVRPMSELVDRATSSRRMLTSLIGGFAVVALGATARAVGREVVGHTLRLAFAGLLLRLVGVLGRGS